MKLFMETEETPVAETEETPEVGVRGSEESGGEE